MDTQGTRNPKAWALFAEGWTLTEIAGHLGCSVRDLPFEMVRPTIAPDADGCRSYLQHAADEGQDQEGGA